MNPNTNRFFYIVEGIAVPGTAEQIAEHFIPDGYETVITARLSNTGDMYIADSQTNAQTAASRKTLSPGQSTTLHIDNTARIWADADNANDRLEIAVQKPLG